MSGADLKLSGTRAGLRHDDRPAHRDGCSSRTRAPTSSATSPTRSADRGRLLSDHRRPEGHAAFRDRPPREIKSWPSIDWEQYPNGISGSNGAQITGIGDLREAKNLALVLQNGALPVTFKTLEQTAISAMLGKDSLAEAGSPPSSASSLSRSSCPSSTASSGSSR